MPNKDNHLKCAKGDESFFKSLDLKTTQYRDWVVTGIFYAAVHYIEAYLSEKMNHHSDSHRTRDSAVVQMRDLKSISEDYRLLKDESINARYYGHKLTQAQIESEIIPLYDAIKTHVSKFL